MEGGEHHMDTYDAGSESPELHGDIPHDILLDGMIKGDADVPVEIKTAAIEQTTARIVEALQMPLPGMAIQPVTVLDHEPGRAVRAAALAGKNSWKTGRHRGSQAQRLYYVADNGIEISLGTPENPLDLEEARKQIKRAGELTALLDRLLFWYWMLRSRPRPGDGKTFISSNGSVPVLIEELLEMLGYKKHEKAEYAGGKQKYTDGYRVEDKDRLTFQIMLLAAFQVSSHNPNGFGIQGAYLRYSLGFWEGIHTGYLINMGDWIHTISLPDLPSLMHIDEKLFKFDRQFQQHEIRLGLYLISAFSDQARKGTLGEPLMVEVEGNPGTFRHITMEELLNEASIKIDTANLTNRFVPRIEEALQVLIQEGMLARAEPVTSINRSQGYWGKAWRAMPMIIQAPTNLIEEYRRLQPPVSPPLLPPGRERRKKGRH